jgi:YaiO family outer membrane protein
MSLVCLSVVSAASALSASAAAQAPLAGGFAGRWLEANALVQQVTNNYGNWQGGYVRLVSPSAHDTWYVDALGLHAFGERGLQVGVTQRHDWNSRFFQMIGANIGSGASIMPRARVDGALGIRLGDERRWQLTGGVSYVKSVRTLSDLAGTAAIAWYAPHAVLIEAGLRYNVSRPGDIHSQRVSLTSIWTPSPRRSLSLRAIGGSEGWQVLNSGTAFTRFQSQEFALAWREKITEHVAVSLQGDRYHNPYYTRSGVTLGVARYW